MDILFLGGVFPRDMDKDVLLRSKQSSVQYAANIFQWGLIDGFLGLENINLSILSAPFIGTYPRGYKDLFIKKFKYNYKNMTVLETVSFCNLWGYRNISRKRALSASIKKFVNVKSEQKVILVYSPHTPFLQAAVYAKQQDPSIHICLVVPDVPQYMNLNENKSKLYSILKETDIKIFDQNTKFVDSFVLLTKHMKDIIKVGDKPYIVVEGIVNTRKMDNSSSNTIKYNKNEEKTLLYTGTLNKKFGVLNLIEAFKLVKSENIILQICGIGDTDTIITEYANNDSRIKFLGQITNDEVMQLQKNATILINPRQNIEEYTRYSFPSKTMEYLLSGNPVIAYKLDGIPNEYDDYLYYVENNTIEALAAKIDEVLSLSEEQREEFGKKAKDFVVNNKNNNSACKRIYQMIKER